MINKSHQRSRIVLLFLVSILGVIPVNTGLLQASEPLLELPDQSGRVRRLEHYNGRIVVLNFWATWCGPCAAEMPIFVQAQKRYGSRGVSVLTASLDSKETEKKIPEFVKKYKMNFPVLLGASPDHLGKFGLGETLPGTVFIDANGAVAFRIIGQAHKKEVFERVEWMLGKRRGKAPESLLKNLPGL